MEANGQGALVIWEGGLGFEDNALLDSAGDPITSVGETIHGGGGTYAHRDRRHIEMLAGESMQDRCIPTGDGEAFALIYDVRAGPFD